MNIDNRYKDILTNIVWYERDFLKKLFYLYRRKYYTIVWPHLGYMKKGKEIFFDSEEACFIYVNRKYGYEKYYNTEEKRKRYWMHPNWFYCKKTYMFLEHNNSNIYKHFMFRDKIYEKVSHYYLDNILKLYRKKCYHNLTLLQITLIEILKPTLMYKYKTSMKDLFVFIKDLEKGILNFNDLKMEK